MPSKGAMGGLSALAEFAETRADKTPMATHEPAMIPSQTRSETDAGNQVMNAICICGHVLLWLGFLGGAFFAVRSTEVKDAPWATISWPAYAAALSVAVAGVVMLRISKRPVSIASDAETHAIDELAAILSRLHGTVEGWSTDSGKIAVYDFHGMIDDALADDLGRFAELRETMIPEFGLDRYAKIMTEFALAERTINRTWSASADGYVDEVKACLSRAVSHLSAVRRCLDEAIEAQRLSR